MPIDPANENKMEEQGFPKELQTAFKQTAEETQCVILSRVPGGATTALIAAGHDLKGYFIKAKSCDWGPMSGFLCQVPAFNKRGVEGIERNAEENLAYYEEFCDRLHSPQEGLDAQTSSDKKNTDAEERIKSIFNNGRLLWQNEWTDTLFGANGNPIASTRTFLKDEEPVSCLSKKVDQNATVFAEDGLDPNNKSNPEFSKRLNTVVHDLRTLVGDDSPFVPLKLTEEVFKNFIKSKPEYTQTIGDITCGIAYKKTGTDEPQFVFFNYIVKKNNGLYELFHGDIWVYDQEYRLPLDLYVETMGHAPRPKFATLGIPTSDNQPGQTISKLCGGNASEVEQTFRQKYQDFGKVNKKLLPHEDHSDRVESFYPIKGIQNYYPPFSGAEAHLNAVTGDYDLFACWPKVPPGGLEDLVRWSEQSEATGDALFSRMSSKKFTLGSVVSRNVFVEFIPTRQHPSFGNINGLISHVAGTLNSFAAIRVRSAGSAKKAARNVAFHSDEGGRPGIDAVEYPVAAFVPAGIATALRGPKAKEAPQMFLIHHHVELLTLIEAVKSECYVPLSFAWVYDFLTRTTYEVKAEKQGGGDMGDEEMHSAVEGLVKTLFCRPPNAGKPAGAGEASQQDTDYARLKQRFEALFPVDKDGKHPKDSAFFAETEDKIEFVLNQDSNATAPVPIHLSEERRR